MEKYIDIFSQLWDHSENEVVEFKKAETNFDIDELGKYFSALSNEANLREHEFAWIGSVNRTVSRLCFLFFASYLCADFISAYK